jgi:hypothetical protein
MDEGQRLRLRAELWARVYAGIAASAGGKQDAGARWADRALAEFDTRFPAPVLAPPARQERPDRFQYRRDGTQNWQA